MTPKEKAKKLLSIFDAVVCEETLAAECALIAVDEILTALKYNLDGATSGSVKYWQEVKTELQKL